jgi:hypothetical protein
VSDSAWNSSLANHTRWWLLALVLAASAAFGQEGQPNDFDNAEPLRPLVRDFAKNTLRDQKDIWTSPFHMTRP